jgi:sulfoxide reductase heme-binding subunit YedZ
VTLPLAAAGPSAYWYLARATGVVSLVLLTVSVVLGVLGPLRVSAPRWPRFAIDSLHRDVSLLVIAVLAVHIVTSVADSFTSISLVNSVIPFTGSYRPLWLGLGAFSFDLLVALAVTSLVRRRLGYRAWRAIHWLAYASWPIAVLHGLGTGTDTKAWWSLLITVACVFAVAVAVWVRFQQVSDLPADVRTPALAATVAVPVAIAVFTLVGPLQKGWAAKAGTPNTLLTSASFAGSARTVAVRSRAATPPAVRLPFSASLAGTVSQSTASGGAIVDLSMRVSGGAHGRLRVRLAGAPIAGGGLSLIGSQIVLATEGMPSAMEGSITSLAGERFEAHLHDAYGHAMQVHIDLNIDNGNDTATGSLSATR